MMDNNDIKLVCALIGTLALLACGDEGSEGDDASTTESSGSTSASSDPSASGPSTPVTTSPAGTNSTPSTSTSTSTSTTDATVGQTQSTGATESTGGGNSTGTETLGTVDFVPTYETGSAWENNTTAREMVDTVFADFEASLRTSGDWDATIEVFLTDDNPGNASTSFEQTFSEATVDNQTVLVVPAWAEIVLGAPDANGPATADGAGAEFTVHFNVENNEDNAGLLRHEMMHGLGAVNALQNFTVTTTGVLGGPAPGESVSAALYDLQLVDLAGDPLLAGYDPATETFEVQNFAIETTLVEWMDGDGGVFFRGAPQNGTFDMPCGTFPIDDTQGRIGLNEPADLMSAGAHPTWNTIDQPDLAFFRAMHYEVF